MSQSFNTMKKMRTPQVSRDGAYAINIYKNESFLVSYLYRDWDKGSVEKELLFLKNRFPEYRNYRVEIG